MAQRGIVALGLVFAALLIFGAVAPYELIYPIQVLLLAGDAPPEKWSDLKYVF
jgi:hypothetical protein